MYPTQSPGNWGNHQRKTLGYTLSIKNAGMSIRIVALSIDVVVITWVLNLLFGGVPAFFEIVWLVVMAGNMIVMPSLTGSSLGYLICGLKVTAIGPEDESGAVPMYYAGIVRLTLRTLLMAVDIVTVYGMVRPLFHYRHQTFGGSLTRTVVLQSRSVELEVRHPKFNAAAA